METINIIAISKKGKSRIGSKLVTAIVEQDHHDKLFVVFPGLTKTMTPTFALLETTND